MPRKDYNYYNKPENRDLRDIYMNNQKPYNSLEDECREEMKRRATMHTDGYNKGHWYSTAIAVAAIILVCGVITYVVGLMERVI